MGWNPINDMAYAWGGARDVPELCRYPGDGPTLIGRILGVTDEDMGRAEYQHSLDEYKDNPLSQQAEALGIEVDQEGTGRLNLVEVQNQVDEAKTLKAAKQAYQAAGGTEDVSGLTAAQIAAKTRDLKGQNEFNTPSNVYARETAEKDRLQAKADADATRAQTLQLEILRGEREDRRFNEQQARLERQDQKNARSALAAGIAALGAAFAI